MKNDINHLIFEEIVKIFEHVINEELVRYSQNVMEACQEI